jgi:hypothetical protein
MDLKRGIDLAVNAVVEELKNRAKKVTSSGEIAQVGTIVQMLGRAKRVTITDGLIQLQEGVRRVGLAPQWRILRREHRD